MRKVALYLLFIISLSGSIVRAQRIDNTASFRNVNGERYIRAHYENDFFTATDIYYTQGYNVELVLPGLKKNPLSKALFRLKNGNMKYGLCFEHIGFTPTSIASDSILYNDRPFACYITLKSFAISTDTIKRMRLSSVLSTGVIGPIAFGNGMQSTIHRWIDDETPHGWQHQVRNDIVINYELSHEWEILNLRNLFSLATLGQIRAGTLNNRAQLGLSMNLENIIRHFQS